MLRRDPRVKVLKKEYTAGPFPPWNCWVKDPRLARSLVNELELFLPQPSTLNPQPSLWFVAHSNGAVIALLTAKRLIARGHKIAGLILTGAACEADLRKNGVLEWCKAGALGKAIAYSSTQDEVLDGDAKHSALNSQPSTLNRLRACLWGKLIWPYGCLGRTGWLLDGKPLSTFNSQISTFHTRWFPGGHSGYFSPPNIEGTFEQIYQDVANDALADTRLVKS
jgi:surfactin synthase thioesterase subunit